MRTTSLIATVFTCFLWMGLTMAQPSTSSPEKAPTKDPGPAKEDLKKKKFAHANPEDITNENFPDLIESFDYPNADIHDIIKAISELTKKNFIVDPQVRGKVTIIAPHPVTIAEAYKAVLSALSILGYTVVPAGKFLKIKSARNAQRDSIETYSGSYFPRTDQMITRIVQLKFISAVDVHKQLRILPSKDGEMVPYPPTNSIIITDFGSNIERVMSILEKLDVPVFEEQLQVIRIHHAKAKDVADLLNQIINKGQGSSKSRFSSSVPRFRRNNKSSSIGRSGAESYSLVVADDRTNSIIVVGNKTGIAKIRRLIAKLDFKLRPEDQGGVFVYYVRHGEAEQVANVLNGIAAESKKSQKLTGKGKTRPAASLQQAISVFGGEVQVSPDKNTNSLIITAGRQDYEVVKNILSKIDIARDQVFVKTIIMEMNSTKTKTWGLDYYSFDRNSNGIGRIGFRSSPISSLLNPTADSGAILGFGSGQTFELKAGGLSTTVTSLMGLVKFLKGAAGGNILSTPQIMVLDNEEGVIEVGETIPVNISRDSSATTGTLSTTANREDVTIKLNLTPFISPDTDSVKLKIEQQVKQLSPTKVQADELAKSAVATTKRVIKTQIVVNSEDTAVLGGLMSNVVSEDTTKVPILGDIPILGWLFKGSTKEKRKSNLVIFITPKIIRNTIDNADLLNRKLNERISFIQRNMNGRDPHGEIIDKLPRRSFGRNQTLPPSSTDTAPGDEMIESEDENNDDFNDNDIFDNEEKEEPAVETF